MCPKLSNFSPGGQLATPTLTIQAAPAALIQLTQLSAELFNHALSQAGQVYCWGNQLTYGGSTPSLVSGLTKSTQIAVESMHACALTSGSEVKCWGQNGYRQLGDGTTNLSATPVTVTDLSGTPIAVAAGEDFSCGLITGGTIQCWGYGYEGRLGNGSTSDSSVPITVLNVSDAIPIDAGFLSACALISGGSIKCWGRD